MQNYSNSDIFKIDPFSLFSWISQDNFIFKKQQKMKHSNQNSLTCI